MTSQKIERLPHVDTMKLFRMPWTMSDNAFSWLELTRNCDLDCEYCYQVHDRKSDKTISEIRKELEGILRLRRCDGIFIAGGEPLIHPDIIEIVQMVKSYNIKPLILTNGHTLTPDLTHQLREAGAFGFVFHVDKFQNRPGWIGKSEKEINRLRQELADMVHKEGHLVCGFNTTILPQTLNEVSDIAEWTAKNINTVATNMFIPVRVPNEDDPWDYYAGKQKIEFAAIPFIAKKKYRNLSAMDLYKEILKVLPDFRFNSYLGGTIRSTAPKWLFGNHIGSSNEIYGNMGPGGMEIIQNFYHHIKGTYLSFIKKEMYHGPKLMILLSLFDREIRKTFANYLKKVIRNPRKLFRKISIQTIIVMQPHDILESGEQDLCDGCPNKTYWEGRLVSECRMEEYKNYGSLLTMVRKECA